MRLWISACYLHCEECPDTVVPPSLNVTVCTLNPHPIPVPTPQSSIGWVWVGCCLVVCLHCWPLASPTLSLPGWTCTLSLVFLLVSHCPLFLVPSLRWIAATRQQPSSRTAWRSWWKYWCLRNRLTCAASSRMMPSKQVCEKCSILLQFVS